MAVQTKSTAVDFGRGSVSASMPVSGAVTEDRFLPTWADNWRFGSESDCGKHFSRCAAKLRVLRPDGGQLREELNLLFDQLLSENYNNTFSPNTDIRPQDVCTLLKHAASLVPLTQEHLVIKLCQLIHHLLLQLKVVMDEQTFNVLLNYTSSALKTCSTWTHSDVLLALSTVVYENGPLCHQHLNELLLKDGVLLRYSAPSLSSMEVRRAALTCLANICLRIPGQATLDDQHRSVCFKVFLETLQSPRPPDTDELFYCRVTQAALKGLHCCLSGGKWKFGEGEELGSVLATLKKLMFQAAPGVNVEWPTVLYPAPLPQYEGVPPPKPDEPPRHPETQKDEAAPNKTPGKKKKKSRGKAKKTSPEQSRGENGEEVKKDGGEQGGRGEGQSSSKPSGPSLYPSWRQSRSDSELSDVEGNAQGKLRIHHGRVRQGALQCLQSLVKSVEKRTLYGYWSSFIPDSPIGGQPSLTLLTVIMKDPSPKVRACALQVLSAMLDGSRQFLAVAEDTASPRMSFTPFSFSLATTIRELHRGLSLALVAETDSQTVTQVLKCLACLVVNAPYHRLRPGLLSPLWKQIRYYLRHRDANVRVSVLKLYGAMLMTQAPLPEVQLLLRQPDSGGTSGSFTPQDSALSWRHRDGEASPSHTLSQHGSNTHSPRALRTPGEEDSSRPWILQLCVSLVTQPREDSQSDSEGAGAVGAGGVVMEPVPVRLEAFQVLSHLVRGYFSLIQALLFEVGQVCTRCLRESDTYIQLHSTKLLVELGKGIIQQHSAESNVPESSRIPISQVVQLWSEVLSGPLNGPMQNEKNPNLQIEACDALASILPQAFAQLPDKTQMMCITVLLGLTYSEASQVKLGAIKSLGVYITFPCLMEDVMFVADTANTVLAALGDKSPNMRAKAAWTLGNLTNTLTLNMEKGGVDFHEELSDMLLLKMLQAATRASADNDRVKSQAVRALGNLLYFLNQSQLTKPAFQAPLEDAIHALVKTVQSESIMKVRWNACYAIGNAFRNPALPLDSALWSRDVFSTLCHVVTSCKNFKVRIKAAAALAVPTERSCYGDTQQFGHVWRSLATAFENSKDTNDFLEYRYCGSLRHMLSQALLHLLGVGRSRDMPALGASLASEEGSDIKEHLLRYLRAEEGGTEAEGEKDAGGNCLDPQQRIEQLQLALTGVRELRAEGDGRVEEEEEGKEVVISFLEDLLKICVEQDQLEQRMSDN